MKKFNLFLLLNSLFTFFSLGVLLGYDLTYRRILDLLVVILSFGFVSLLIFVFGLIFLFLKRCYDHFKSSERGF